MKRLLAFTFLIAFLGFVTPAFAQDTTKHSTVGKVTHKVKKGAKKAWKGTKKGARKVGNETAELSTKGKAKLTDKTSDEWVGPEGQKIYVDDGNKYYWINEKGGRMFVSKDQLKAKQ
ncbi:MAG: hypothetical protein EON98_02575 [Chitinophagaceae bacterium]|nr:MAG: hypothetical protein EON98_02575 [Chitinophagaceae bacterium]